MDNNYKAAPHFPCLHNPIMSPSGFTSETHTKCITNIWHTGRQGMNRDCKHSFIHSFIQQTATKLHSGWAPRAWLCGPSIEQTQAQSRRHFQ